MANELTGCQRLGNLECVDGERADNLQKRQGTFGHRRVDKPDRKTVQSPESSDKSPELKNLSDQRERLGGDDSPTSNDSPTPLPAEASRPSRIHARSVDLSAPKDGRIARLDLAEVDGDVGTPVDDKRGKAPKVAEGTYEPELVQLCAQGLILRENVFQCDRDVLYFIASKQRVIVEFTDKLIARTRQLRNDFCKTVAGGQLPPPLVDSPNCPRCSLVGIPLASRSVSNPPVNSSGPDITSTSESPSVVPDVCGFESIVRTAAGG